MKKLVSLLLAGAIGTAGLIGLTACGDNEANIDKEVEEGQKLTSAQLLEKAKEESGDFVAYGNTSRITTAMTNFIASDYGKALGLSSSNASAQKKTDSEIYSLLEAEEKSANKSKNASMVLIQDSATLEQYRTQTTMLTNYIPNGMENYVDSKNRVPFAHQFINKLFMYNTAGETNLKFTNVWQLTDVKYKNNIFFKNPRDEQVNMNFLIMLTSEEWSNKLKTAYVAQFGAEATDVGQSKDYENYGYKWIAEFISNCNFTISSDTTIAQKLSTTENTGKMGLFVLSKLRDSSVYGDNLAVSAWDKKNETEYQKIDPFAGFMYSIYAQLATNGSRPYTAMLFINYLMTEEGFTPWKSLGGYSSSSQIPVYEGSITKPVEQDGKIVYTDNNKKEMYEDGKVGDKKKYTYFDGSGSKVEGDKITVDGKEVDFKASVKTEKVSTVKDSPLSFWQDNLVVEDGEYILSVKAKALDWINKKLPSK